MNRNTKKGAGLPGKILVLLLSVFIVISPAGGMLSFAMTASAGDAAAQNAPDNMAEPEKAVEAEDSKDAGSKAGSAQTEADAEESVEKPAAEETAEEKNQEPVDAADQGGKAEDRAADDSADVEELNAGNGSDQNDQNDRNDPEQAEAAEKTEAAEEKDEAAEPVTQTAKAGDATITAEYTSDAFEEEVTLKVRALDSDSAEFRRAEKAADKVTDKKNKAVYAFDIAFVTADGRELEPSKDVKTSIRFSESPADDSQKDFNLVHIDDNGRAAVIEDSTINKDASKVVFESDQFSVYVVTAEQEGCVAVGDQYFTTLAEAIEAASDGDTINIIGTTADTGVVAVNKSVTILSDGADGSLPNGLDANGGTITLGGGSNTLTMGAVWATTDDDLTLNIEDGVHITGDLPLYMANENAELNIHGGKIEQTQERDNWNTAVGVYDGVINEVTGGEIIGLGDGIYCYSTINTISGGTITAGEYGMYLGWCTVESISGGTISGREAGIFMYYLNDINEISGGRINSENGPAIHTDNWGASTLSKISGGIFVGKPSISGEATKNEYIDVTGGAFKSTSGGQAIDSNIKVDFTNGAENVRWIETLEENSYKIPDGYAPSTDTVKVDGVEGDFHYFAHKYTITYDGNGGKTSNNKTSIEDEVVGAFQAAECDFIGPDGKVFKEWNTADDGSGDSYAEGAEITPNSDMTLYAIWETPEGPVSIGDVVYNNIREAMAAAQDGDTIVVNKNCSDTSEPIVVDKEVTIVAGNKNVSSTGANLQVNAGKTLTLGSGDASGNTLTFKGGVNVTNGRVMLQDGFDLRKTLKLNSENAKGTITGGKIKVSSGNAINVDTGAVIDSISGGTFTSSESSAVSVSQNAEITSISGGTFKSTSGHGMDLYGTVQRISGKDTVFQGSSCGIYVRPSGVLNTIDNGQFSSTTTNNNYISAGIFVQGKCVTINDGTFTGSQGAQFGNTTNFAPPDVSANAGVEINGGTFRGVRSFGIDFVGNSKSTILDDCIKNATIISEQYYALNISGGHHFSEISNSTVIGGKRWDGITTTSLSYSSNTTTIDKIVDSTFSGMTIGCNSIVGTIDSVKVTGSTQFGGYNGNAATIETVSNSSFADIYVRKAVIDKMDSITATGGLHNSDDGTIALITGETTRIEGSYATPAIENEGRINIIESGTFVGKDDGDGYFEGSESALYNHGEEAVITKISGGTFTTIGENCSAIRNEDRATIQSIEGKVKAEATSGTAVANDGGNIGGIKGEGIYIGTENAIASADRETPLEADLVGSDKLIGNARYQTDENTPASEVNENVKRPAGYHFVKSTTTAVPSEDGRFRFLIKDNTIIYDGNGHDLASDSENKPVDTLDLGGTDPTPVSYEEGQVKASSNGRDVHYQEDNMTFLGWNTKADGTGKTYKVDDPVQFEDEFSDVVLYAQWGVKITYKIADADTDKGTVARNNEATQKIEDGAVTEVIAPNEAVATAFGLSTSPAGATATSSDAEKYMLVNWTDEDNAEVGTDASYVPSSVPAKNATYTAHFTKLWDLTFDEDGGTPEAADQKVEDGKKAAKPDADPAKDGFSFKHWAEKTGDAVAQVAFDFLNTAITKDTALKAIYDEHTYNIHFDANSDEGISGSMTDMQGIKYTEDKALTENAFNKTGYTFTVWNTVKTPSDATPGTKYDDKAVVKSLTPTDKATVNMYAQWKANAYTVKFDANGGTGNMTDQSFKYDEEKALTKNAFTRVGYTFGGWNTVKTPSDETPGTKYADEKAVKNLTSEDDGVVTLYAQWNRITYTITFDSDGGSAVEPIQVMHGDNVDNPPAPVKEGYTFEGWYTTSASPEKFSFRNIKQNWNLKAHWSKLDNLTVTHYLDRQMNYQSNMLGIGAYEFMGVPDYRPGSSQYSTDYASYCNDYKEYTIKDIFDAQTSDSIRDMEKLSLEGGTLKIGAVVKNNGEKYKLVKVTVNGTEITAEESFNTTKYYLKDKNDIKFYYEMEPIEIIIEGSSYEDVYDGETHEVSGFEGDAIKVWYYQTGVGRVGMDTTKVKSASDGKQKYSFAPDGWNPSGTIRNVNSEATKVLPSEDSGFRTWEKDGDYYIVPAGKYELYYANNKITNFDPSCYVVKWKPGTMKVTPADLTITAKDQEYDYNGSGQGENNTTYTDSEAIGKKIVAVTLKGSDVITSITLNGLETYADIYADKISASGAKIGTNGELNGNYNIKYENGKLTIKETDISYKSENTSQGTVTLDSEKVGKKNNVPAGSSAVPATGYHLVNWTDDNDSNKEVSTSVAFKPENLPGAYTAHFAPNSYTVKFNANTGTGTTADQSFKYDEEKALTTNAFTKAGYTFTGWNTVKTPSDETPGTKYADKDKVKNLTAEDGGVVTLYAQWTANTNTKYTVEFYYQENGDYPAQATSKDETRTGKTDTEVYVTDNDKKPAADKTGYVLDGAAANVFSGNIAGDGSLVLKVYFKQQFTVDYKKGEHGTFDDKHHEGLDYNEDTPAAPETTGEAGYNFAGWFNDATNKVESIAEKVIKNLSYTASWNVETYPITYDLDGGALADGKTNPETYTVETETFTLNNPTKEGYSFEGWTGTGLDAANKDVSVAKGSTGRREYKATWKVNQYTITFDSNGGSAVAPITQDYGSQVTAPADPTREGYTFGGWDKEIPSTMPAENMTITARWTVNQYKVSYEYIGTVPSGASRLPAESEYDFGSSVTVADNATAAGYTFSGWTSQEVSETSGSFTMPGKDVKFTGSFTANGNTAYKVEHYQEKVGGGYELKDTEELTGQTDTEATANPKSYEGFTFNAGAAGTVQSGNIAGDGSLVLKLYYDRDEHTITFDSNGGSAVAPITQKYDSPITNPADPTREGYTFEGWDKEIPEKMPAENQTITAQWKVNQYDITYDLAGGALAEGKTNPATYTVETETFTLNNPTREGYTFKGWTGTGLDSATKDVSVAKGSTGNRTYTATWTVNQYKVTYEYSGTVPSGASRLPAESEYDFGSSVTVADPATAAGYTFSGWTSQDVSAASGSFTMPAKDVKFTGSFIANGNTAYKVEHYQEKVGGGYELKDTENLTGQTDTEATANPMSYKGFTFNAGAAGTVQTGSIAGDGSLVLKLYYDRDEHTITFNTNGGSAVAPITQKYGSPVTAPADPTREGYTFAGWDKEIPRTMPAENQTITAKWKVNQYNITYDLAGGALADGKTNPATYTVETETFTLNNPTREGYTFEGWTGTGLDSATKDVSVAKGSTGNRTYTATWTANQYTITFDSNGGSAVAPITQEYGTDVTKPADPTREGYTFDGWDKEIPSTMPAENMTITAQWKVNQYKVTYEYSGTVPSGASRLPAESEHDFGNSVTVADPATAAGYTFSGWTTQDAAVSGSSFSMPAKDVKFTGSFTANGTTPYKVEHYQEKVGGGYELKDTEDLTGQTDAEATANPKSYEGFTFNAGAAGTVQTGSIAGDGSLVLKLYYDRDEHTITFNTNGGSAVAPITQKYGSPVTAPADPTREGYTFAGWDKPVPGTMPAEDVTITARWTVNQYKVSYEYLGTVPSGASDLPADANHDFGSTVTVADDASARGYTFSGWTSQEVSAASGTFSMPATDVKFTGSFTANGNTPYKVEHYLEKLDGGYELEETEDLTGQTDAETTANPKSYEGFTFNQDADGTVQTGNIAGDGSLVLKLYYDRNEYPVTFNSNGGSNVPDQTVKHGGTASKPDDPTRRGYNFKGWLLNGQPYDFSSPVTGPITLTASWDKIPAVKPDVTPDDDDEPTPDRTPDRRPARPAAPAAVPAAPAQNAPAEIADEPAPQAEPEAEPETIPEVEPPKAEEPEENPWALLNLIAAALSTVGAVLALFRRRDEEDDQNTDEDEENGIKRRLNLAKAGGAAASIVSIIAFILTEDMSNPMALTDKWTLLMAILFAAQIGTAVFAKKYTDRNEDTDE